MHTNTIIYLFLLLFDIILCSSIIICCYGNSYDVTMRGLWMPQTGRKGTWLWERKKTTYKQLLSRRRSRNGKHQKGKDKYLDGTDATTDRRRI